MVGQMYSFIAKHVSQIQAKSSGLLAQRQSDILAAAALIMISYGISFILGILRERLLYGTFFHCCRDELDVYRAAFRWPEMLFQITVAGTLSAAFIPLLSEHSETNSANARAIANQILRFLLAIFALGAVIIWIAAPQLSAALTGNFTAEQLSLMTTLTRLLLISQFFFIISQWVSSILQSNHRFLAPSLAPVFYNLAIVLGIVWLGGPFGIYGPVFGVIGGSILHLLIQVPAIINIGFYQAPSESVPSLSYKEIFNLSLPRTIAIAISQMELNAGVFFTTSLAAGSLSLFDLARILRQVPVQLIGVAIGQAAFPSLSKINSNNHSKFSHIIQETSLQILYLVLPLSAMLLILRIPIVRLAFGAESFPWDATKETAYTVGMFTIAIPAYALCQLINRAFYAIKDTRTPLILNTLELVIFLVGGYWSTFYTNGGIRWLAFVSSAAGIIQTVFLLQMLHRRIHFLSSQWIINVVKLGVATVGMLISLWIPFRFLDDVIFDTKRVIPLIALTITASSCGLAVYLILCHALAVKSQLAIWKLIVKFPGFNTVINRTQAWFEPAPPSSNY